jgi:hypothetical protein
MALSLLFRVGVNCCKPHAGNIRVYKCPVNSGLHKVNNPQLFYSQLRNLGVYLVVQLSGKACTRLVNWEGRVKESSSGQL